jgi:hypothetical protein
MPIAIIMLSLAAVSLAFSIYSIVRSVRERRMHQKQKQEYERRKALQEHLAGVWRMGPPTGEVGCPCKDARLLAAFADWSMSQNAIELAQLREIVDRINQAEIDNLSKGNKGFDFTEAQAFFKAIPAITVEQIIANMKRSREMLIVRAFDSGGIVIDVLVLDVDGTISTVARDGVLSRAVSAIRGTPGMATPQAARMLFIDWQPQGCSLSDPVIALHSGTTDDIAQSIFLGTL